MALPPDVSRTFSPRLDGNPSVQVKDFLASGGKQIFVLRKPLAGAPFTSGPSSEQPVHVRLSSTAAIENDLPELMANIYSAIGSNDNLSFSYESPKGSLQTGEWLYILIDCGKAAGKVPAGVIAKAIYDYYKSKFARSKENARIIVLYGPDSEVYKKFTVERDRDATKIRDEARTPKHPAPTPIPWRD